MVIKNTGGSTEFRVFRPDARQVFLVGDFTGWHQSVPMSRTLDGEWVCELELPPGVYMFQYLIDGRWNRDQDSAGVGGAPCGYNAVTVMPAEHSPCYAVG